ncbi:NUDIX hydrolase [Amycolatopsis sp. FU40]|nr:NUDIX hydrolase [Amycolatopsis sp. FU40]UKD59162.1 NUDIX hydrolase [Amycolatopsis sp. FU40]
MFSRQSAQPAARQRRSGESLPRSPVWSRPRTLNLGKLAEMSFRLAAYAVCIENESVLLARYVSPKGGSNWTLPGGGVEHAEDPFDAVIREVFEETGCEAVVERLLGVDSRVIPTAERLRPGPIPHHNVGIFYQARIVGGRLRPEPNGETAESVWTPLPAVVSLRRSGLVDVGLSLARSRPRTGHVGPVAVGGLIRH